MLKKYEKAERKLYMIFVDLEKAFNRVPREVILRRKGLMEREVFAIEEMYKRIKTSMKIDGKRSKEFEVKVKSIKV